MLRHIEIGRHAAAAVDAARERDRAQIAAQVVAPRVVDALEVLPAATVVQADQRAAMGAAVLEGAEVTVLGARDHDGHGANKRGAVVADVGEFGLQAEKVPDRAFEYALLLKRQDVGVGVHPVGDAGETFRPNPIGDCIHRRLLLLQYPLPTRSRNAAHCGGGASPAQHPLFRCGGGGSPPCP